MHAATGFRLTPLGEPQRLLGVPLCADPRRAAGTAFHNSAGKLLGAAAKWAAVPLSLEGRAHVAKQCLASKLVFQASHLPAPPAQLEAAQRVLRRFVATGAATAEEAAQHKQPMPAEHVLALPKPLGGMSHAILRHAADSLMAKHVAALFGPGWQPWKRLLRHELAGADDQAGLPTWDPLAQLPGGAEPAQGDGLGEGREREDFVFRGKEPQKDQRQHEQTEATPGGHPLRKAPKNRRGQRGTSPAAPGTTVRGLSPAKPGLPGRNLAP